MINLFKLLRKKSNSGTTNQQQDLLDFVRNKDNLIRAVEGSMSKRNALLKSVKLSDRSL